MNSTFRVRLLLVCTAVSIAAVMPRAEIIEQVLVKVNGEALTKSDLEARQVVRLREQGQRVDIKSDPNNVQLRKLLDDVTPQVLIDAVDEMLVVQRGKELGYKLSDDQFKTLIDNIRKENKLEADEAFQAALKQEGISVTDLRRNMERQMIWQRVQQNEVLGRIAMSEEEARAYYDAHLKEFTTESTIMLREVLVASPVDPKGSVNVAADEAAKGRADAIRARVLAGDSFEKLASDVSDSPTRTNAGLIGPLNMSDLSADVKKIIEALKVGDITETLHTVRGYQILKLESRSENQTQPFDQAREQIANRVMNEKRRQEFEKYLVKLRAQAIIDWKNQDVKKAYLEGLKQPVAGASTPSN